MAETAGTGVGLLAGLLIIVGIGGIVGWLASLIVKGSGLGPIGDVALGVAGAFFAGYVLPMLGVNTSGSMIAGTLAAVAGAVAVLFFVRVIRRT